MSKAGLPVVKQFDATGLAVAVITATWNEEICDQLHKRALETAAQYGATARGFRVVGALEVPVMVQKAAQHYDAVVALGCVIRGGTPHFDYVCDSVTQGLTRISLDTGKPVGNGILTVNDQNQAYDRSGFPDSAEDKGAESMVAALDTAIKLRQLSALASEQDL